MTKAFLEPIVLKPENENLVHRAFSKDSLEKAKAFNKKRTTLKRTTTKKLSMSQLV
jgi:hypothetical protein